MGGVGEKLIVCAFTGVMGPVLGKLTKLMGEEYAKLKGVRKKMESLMRELTTINVALEKYAQMEKPDKQVKAWMKEVRDLAYDIEDCIDLFMCHLNSKPDEKNTSIKGLLHNNIRKLKKLKYRHEFAGEIHELQALVNDAYERRVKYKLDDCSSAGALHTEIDPRLPALYVLADKLVGIDGPRLEIIKWFIGEDSGPIKQRRLVSIVGPGGLGKTTLANQVYKEIKDQFDCAAFVSVSLKPNINNLLKEMHLEICSNGRRSDNDHLQGSENDRQLINKLRSYLETKRYFIVIDDLWSESAWEIIQCALPSNMNASRLITTTRINSVANFCCTSNEDFVYQMKPLGRSDSKSLFLKRTFCGDNNCPVQLEGIMDEILHKCGGLPLAIITIASLLASKQRRREEWERVRNSICSIHEVNRELEVMEKILSLSYCDLPHHLKTCLLYLSIFPEDYKISRDCLVWGWIAEGFITAKRGYNLKELGEGYFYELINRNMIRPVCSKYDGDVSACQVHDIVLDFIISRSVEENFVCTSDGHHHLSTKDKIRRLSIWNNNEQYGLLTWKTMNLYNLRSLYMFNGTINQINPLSEQQALRVLHLEGRAFENGHLDNIGRLFQLRYLVFRKTRVNKLPDQIGQLQFLQTLDIRGTNVKEPPESIIHLKQLMHLVGDEIILPDGFGKMEALQVLSCLNICKSSKNFGQDLENLIKLRVLRISWLYPYILHGNKEIYEKALISSLRKLGEHSLRSLYIRYERSTVDFLTDSWCPPCLLQKFVLDNHYPILMSRFPKWINSTFTDLTYLDICVQQMEETDVYMLQELPALVVLHLRLREVPREGLTISQSGFHCLTAFFFKLECGKYIGQGLMFEAGAMPKLEVLELILNAHESNSSFDFGIRHLSSLKDIKVEITSMCRSHFNVEDDIRNEIMLLPNHPKADIGLYGYQNPPSSPDHDEMYEELTKRHQLQLLA